ncbi:MAG TPA: sterol desaturase family protein [Burkholderiaceae bacterium]|jgi:sterol desaturase/sphingolipid hydroxylase (fatty acid hydroxylase superfamily)
MAHRHLPLLLMAFPFALGLSLIEAWWLARRGGYDWKALGISVLDMVLRLSVQIFLPLSIAAGLFSYAAEHRLTTIELNSWVAFLGLFIGQEFFYYWYHRAAHRVRWFWCNHSVHHSPNTLNLGAAYRIGIVGKLTGTPLFFAPLAWLGFPQHVVFEVLSLNLLYQFWLHTSWIPKLGPLEYLLNTPSAHRVHHASNLEYLDANYGGVLIVFDRLFGTYRAERDDLPCRYGLIDPVTSYNPLRIEFAPWLKLARDLASARSPRALLGYLFMPPGWKAEGPGDTVEELRARAAAGAASAQHVVQGPEHRGIGHGPDRHDKQHGFGARQNTVG